MSTITIQVNEDTLKKMADFYKTDIIDANNPHVLFVAKTLDCTISAYKSKKVVFQGQSANDEAKIWQTIGSESSFYQKSIGSDEVGTGDYFGPVVVVAAYIDDETIKKIKPLNIDDSKKISDDTIIKIAPTLFKLLPYSLLIVHNEKYNEVIKTINLNQLKAQLHHHAIKQLINKINFTPKIIIDQFCTPNLFVKYTKDQHFASLVSFHTKAESSFASVACASIMARYIFLQEMDKLSAIYDTKLLKGASSKVDDQAKALIKDHGTSILNKIAKLHFKNTEKILK